MGPATAIKTGFGRSFSFKGRATRFEFWWFAPVAILFASAVTWVVAKLWNEANWFTHLIVLFFSLTPFWASGARRLQDTGESGQDIFLPAALFFGVPIALVVVSYVMAIASPFLTFLMLLFGFLLLLVVGPFLMFVAIGPVIGQLLVPSDPSSNRFGPNPHEVSS